MKRRRILRSTPDIPRVYRSRRQREDDAYESDLQRAKLAAKKAEAAEAALASAASPTTTDENKNGICE